MDFIDTLRRALGLETRQDAARRNYVGQINQEPAFTQEQINNVMRSNVGALNREPFFTQEQIARITEEAKTGEKASKSKKSSRNSEKPTFFDYLQKSVKEEEVEEPSAEDRTSTVKKGTKKSSRNSEKPTFFDYLKKSISDDQSEAEIAPETIESEVKQEETSSGKEDEAEEKIEYTYKPGDTFGQVLLNLGLSDGSNLWGPDGDVAYYTQQLIAQNMLDERGNVKLGVPFYLTRRK